MDELSDEALMARVAMGESWALEALVHRYRHRVYGVLLRGVGRTAEADDLFQETWLRVITRIHRYDEDRPFEPWLFAVARNLALDHLRRTSPESLDEPSETGGSRGARLGSEEPGTLDRLLDRERQEVLVRTLALLPALYREALTLRFEEEMTFEEMAAVLSAPVSTVKSRVQRALALLRRRMT